jgi:transposase-like protein
MTRKCPSLDQSSRIRPYAVPKSAHPAARKALAQVRDAEDRQQAWKAITAFATLFGIKHPKAVAKVVDDTEQLLAFYDFLAEHLVHLKTSNPIESTFATVRLRTKVTKGPGSRAAGLQNGVQARGPSPGSWTRLTRRGRVAA